MKTQIEINENGTVRVDGEIANYDNLLTVIDPVGEYTTHDGNTLVLFPHNNGFIELLLDGSFGSGEEANYTTLSFDEIMNYYNIK